MQVHEFYRFHYIFLVNFKKIVYIIQEIKNQIKQNPHNDQMAFKKYILNQEFIQKITDNQQPDKLYKLNCISQNIAKIDPCRKYNKMRCLQLEFNYIEKMQCLHYFTDLRQLHLEGNGLCKIQALENNKNLTVLNLSANHIEKIQNIQQLIKLETLNLSKNKISKISNLQMLKDLKNLNLSSNKINSLDSLPSFSKIEILLLSNNEICKIPQNLFANSSKILRLDLSHNKIFDVSFLEQLTNLQYLNLSFNRLQVFFGNAHMKYLQQLYLNNNQLQKIPNIGQNFPELVILDVKSNMICSQHDLITCLSGNQMLTDFNFIENPICTKDFQETLFHIYKFDRINTVNLNEPGTKYMKSIHQIEQTFKTEYFGIQDDEEDRKIKMSGFYNDELQNRMTGIKPQRALSPTTKKAVNLKLIKKLLIKETYTQIQKNYKQFIQNDNKIKSLRQIYVRICQDNNMQAPNFSTLLQSQKEVIYLTEQIQKEKQKNLASSKSQQLQQLSQLRQRNDTNQKVMNQAKRQKEAKWAELKAKTKQKSFNIRKSSRNKELSGSNSKISNQLMKTQLNPRRPLQSAILGGTATTLGGKTFYSRPSSQRKVSQK